LALIILFEKRHKKQFQRVISNWLKRHDLTVEQEQYLKKLIPDEFASGKGGK
jgi:hypothetical protein